MKTLILTLALFYSLVVSAAEPHAPLQHFFNPDSFTLNLYYGDFQADLEPQFINSRSKSSFMGGMHGDFANTPNMGLDLEIIDFGRKYDNTQFGAPIFGTIDEDIHVSTTAFLFGGRAFIPASHAFRAYASAGLGYFKSTMTVYGSVFGLPAWHKQTHDQFGFYHGAGIEYRFKTWGLSLDYRRFSLKADFSDFKISNANIGGNVILLGWLYRI